MIKKEDLELRLINGLIRKDEMIISEVYDRYSAALYGVIKRIVIDERVAEEVLHDVFVKVFSKIDQFDQRKGRLFTWMMNLSRNTAIDKTRSRSFKENHKSNIDSDYVHTIDQHFSSKINTEDIGVKELLEDLESDQKQIIDLLYFRGYSQSEISKEFDIPLGTVKTRSRTALKKLRRIVGL